MAPETIPGGSAVPPPADLPISPAEVRRLAACGPDHRWDPEVQSAIAEARRLLVPRVRAVPLQEADLEGLFCGTTPVATIARRGERWAFVATIGAALETRVRELLASGAFLEGMLLDAAGSAAAESLSDRIEADLAGGLSSERFSPGYCGWEMRSQTRLFALLRPEEVGIRLLPSMLMTPLKSVSGLVVRAAAEVLQVPAETCEACDARGCVRRRATGEGRGR